MAIIKEVIDDLEIIAASIQFIKDINEAVNEGTNYVTIKHPEIKKDLKIVILELQKMTLLIAKTSAILTQFHFAISNDSWRSELARFNDYFIRYKFQSQSLKIRIFIFKTCYYRIYAYADKISEKRNLQGFFEKLGLHSYKRESDLGEKLHALCNLDAWASHSAEIMLKCLDLALNDVQNTLCNSGLMYPENIPIAAALLSEYATLFSPIEKSAQSLAEDIQKSILELE